MCPEKSWNIQIPKYTKNYKDIEYYVPGRKRNITGSTKAVYYFLVIVHEEYPKLTIRQLKELITDRNKYILQPEQVDVLDSYIKAGFGNHVPH